MNKCEHNDKIQLFCVSQHCEWKQAGGCQACIKKYHNHIGNTKFLNQQDIQNIIKKFSIDHSYKPNCRNIQQAIYSYFGNLKSQLTNSIDLICKTFITQLGSPYLFQSNLYTIHKRIKNKEYKRLHQKDFRKLYEASKKVNANELSKQEGKIYREHLKKNQKFTLSLENVMASYQSLLKQPLENFKHQKTSFDSLNALIKQTLQGSDFTTNLSHFHEKQIQKYMVEKADKMEKNQTKKLSNDYEQLSKHNSGILVSSVKQRQKMELCLTINPKVSKQTKIQGLTLEQKNHKLGIKDLKTLEKSQKRQVLKQKRQISLDRNIVNNNSIQIQLKQDKNEQKRPNMPLLGDHKIQDQRHKINLADQKADFTSDYFSQKSTKKSQNSSSLPKDRNSMTAKQSQISIRKEQLIQMMKNHSATYKNYQKQRMLSQNEKNNDLQSLFTKNQSSIIESPIKNVASSYKTNSVNSGDSPVRKNLSIVVQDKKTNPMPDKRNQPKLKCPILPKWQVKSIQNINSSNQNQSTSSLQEIKQLLPKNNMYAHSRLPIQESQDINKQIGCSRLIIVPTQQKFNIGKYDQCDSPLIKKKVNLSKNYKDLRSRETRFDRKQSESPVRSSQKSELRQNEQRSLNLLIKSVNLNPSEAISLLQQAIKQSPNNLSAAQYLSYLYLENNRPRDTITVCNMILDRFEITTKENEELLILLQNNKSAALNILGRYSEAIIILERVLRIKQKDTLLKNLGDAYYFNSNYQKAIYYYEKALKLNPSYDQAYYNMSVCLFLQKNFNNAKISILKALQSSPKNPQYLQLKRQIQEQLEGQTTRFKSQ